VRLLNRLSSLFRRDPKTPEDVAADKESARISAEVASNRFAAKSGIGSENYLSQRRDRK
jgi:hypothetical protein